MSIFSMPKDEAKIRQIIEHIDYTSALDPFSTSKDVIDACQQVKKFGFATVCVYPTWVKLAKEHMAGSDKGILVTIGFPHGSTTTQAKCAEAKQALEDGATEIDMVINIARMFDGDYAYVEQDIAAVVACCKEYHVGVKVIIETGYLSDEQKVTAAKLALSAGAEYVKTCTGFGPGKATLHDILLLKDTVGNRAKVKASGGVASLEDQWAFLEAGASRVAGRGVILEQLKRIGFSV
ncbi:MAG TPA: deoxyribose-phosphate aldolase [Clostridia bacterium]|jgi:deoxyribose-phosphate aldolase|nr:deoxyribose-phosphate aldolase [Clostridia bacterium]